MVVHDVRPSSMSMFMFIKKKIGRIRYVSITYLYYTYIHIIIERSIFTMVILDHPGLLKVGSFGIHIPMAMRMMVLHA